MLFRIALALLLSGLFSISVSSAETYVAGQLGYSLPNKLSNIEAEDSAVPDGTTISDTSLKTACCMELR
jgi:hypothetical protein